MFKRIDVRKYACHVGAVKGSLLLLPLTLSCSFSQTHKNTHDQDTHARTQPRKKHNQLCREAFLLGHTRCYIVAAALTALLFSLLIVTYIYNDRHSCHATLTPLLDPLLHYFLHDPHDSPFS